MTIANFNLDDFVPDKIYRTQYPHIILWVTSKDNATSPGKEIQAQIIERQNSPKEDSYFIPSVRLSLLRQDHTHDNDPRRNQSLEPVWTMQEAVQSINTYIQHKLFNG